MGDNGKAKAPVPHNYAVNVFKKYLYKCSDISLIHRFGTRFPNVFRAILISR